MSTLHKFLALDAYFLSFQRVLHFALYNIFWYKLSAELGYLQRFYFSTPHCKHNSKQVATMRHSKINSLMHMKTTKACNRKSFVCTNLVPSLRRVGNGRGTRRIWLTIQTNELLVNTIPRYPVIYEYKFLKKVAHFLPPRVIRVRLDEWRTTQLPF